MSNYTAEQVERTASQWTGLKHDMLMAFAALLRERESAKAMVTEEMINAAAHALAEYDGADPNQLIWEGNPPEPWGEIWNLYEGNARAAIEAVAPMLASARVAVEMPAEFGEWFGKNYPGPDTIIGNPHWHAPRIWRAARRALLAAAPKSEKEE